MNDREFGGERGRVILVCRKCLHVGQPVRCYSKNASVWYQGCAKCSGGVFYTPTP